MSTEAKNIGIIPEPDSDPDDDLITALYLAEQEAWKNRKPDEDDALQDMSKEEYKLYGYQAPDERDDGLDEIRGDKLLFPVHDDEEEIKSKLMATSSKYGIEDIENILRNAPHLEKLIVHILSNKIQAIAEQIRDIPTRVAFYEEIIDQIHGLLAEQKYGHKVVIKQ